MEVFQNSGRLPLEADSKSVSFPVDIHANEPRFTAEINMF